MLKGITVPLTPVEKRIDRMTIRAVGMRILDVRPKELGIGKGSVLTCSRDDCQRRNLVHTGEGYYQTNGAKVFQDFGKALR